MSSRNRLTIGLSIMGLTAASLVWAQDAPDSQQGPGELTFAQWCAPCHADAPAMPGTQALAVKYNGSLPAALLERADLTPELISFYVRNGISVMPPFRKTEITDADLSALAAYIVETAAE